MTGPAIVCGFFYTAGFPLVLSDSKDPFRDPLGYDHVFKLRGVQNNLGGFPERGEEFPPESVDGQWTALRNIHCGGGKMDPGCIIRMIRNDPVPAYMKEGKGYPQSHDDS